MRAILTLLLAGAAGLAQVPGETAEFTLSNGIRVVTRQTGASGIEGLAFFLEGGSRALGEATQGVENLAFEACLMGSGRYPGETWRSLMDLTQARLEGVYAYDFSAIRLMCLEEDLPVLLDALADCLVDPELDPSAFERTRDGLVQTLLRERSDPDSRVWQASNEGLFAGHPYRLLPSGTPETMSALGIRDIEEHLEARLVAGDILISHAGPASPEDLRAMLEASFGRVPPGTGDLPPVPPFQLDADTVVFEAEEVPTAYIVAKFPSPSMDAPDFPLFSAAMDVVSDRFWQVLRTEQGLTYATYAGTGSSLRNWAYMYVSTPEPSVACSLMVEVVSEGAAGGFSAVDIAGSIEAARTGRLMSLASVYNLSYLMGLYQIQTGDWRNLWLYSDIARDMDSAELGGVLSRWLGPVSWGVIADPAVAAPESLTPPTFEE